VDKDAKFPRRVHLQRAAERGDRRAAAALEGPEYPEEFVYLYRWALELLGRSGVGMSGYAPLSYGTIADWVRLTGTEIYPHEVRALLQLDAVLRNPEGVIDA
jgi:hypothetical protein